MRVSDEKEAREADCLAADAVDIEVTSDDRDDVDGLLGSTGCRGAPTGASAHSGGHHFFPAVLRYLT